VSDARIIYVGDLHVGARNGSQVFIAEFTKFCRDVLIPLVDRVKPHAVVFLGDLFDSRVAIPIQAIAAVVSELLDPLDQMGVNAFFLLGNHDLKYRNTLTPNSVAPLLKRYPTLICVDKPTDVDIAGVKHLIVPWICDENRIQVELAIDETDAEVLCGHFEITGFAMTGGRPCEGGIDPERLQKFKRVYSGHFHGAQDDGVIKYVGSAYQLTRDDTGILKEIVFRDGCTEHVVENPSEVFHRVYVEGSEVDGEPLADWIKTRAAGYSQKYVDVIVSDPVGDVVDRVVTALEDAEAENVLVIDPTVSQSEMSEDEVVDIQTKSTEQLIREYVETDASIRDEDRERVFEILNEAYKKVAR